MAQELRKLLIIEDEEELMKLLSRKLSEAGYAVSEAKDGEQGLAMALNGHPDLILLDLILPKLDGLTLLTKLRTDEWGKNAKVIVLTNLADANAVSMAATNMVNDFLVKTDWTLDQVLTKVKERLA